MEGKRTVAYIASLDTKLRESMFARDILRQAGCEVLMIDISTRTLLRGQSDISPEDILSRYGMTWEEFDPLDKADSIDTMSKALIQVLPQLCEEGRFDGVLSIGGGQNAKMAAAAIKELPFGMPKLVASSLACGKRTMEQYVGANDILVMHTVADISGINRATKTIISNACHAMAGMVNQQILYENEKKTVAATMLGITSKGVEGAMSLIPDDTFEKVCFHANGVGGRCMEKLMEDDQLDVVLDMTLHEITGEILGGYCTGAKNRLMKGIEKEIPMVVVPGALDMLDFFIDEDGNGLPDNIDKRKKVYHNSSICHTKVFRDEAIRLAGVVCQRLNQARGPVTLVLPEKGFCEASAPGAPMYDGEVDLAFIETFEACLDKKIKLVRVDANINEEKCYRRIAQEVLLLT